MSSREALESAPLADEEPTEATGGAASSGRMRFTRRLRSFDELGVLSVLVVLVVGVSLFHPEFLSQASVANMMQQAAFYGLIAIGMVFVLSMGELDLSVAGNFAFSAMVAALLAEQGINLWLAGLVAVLVGSLLGVINALLANLFGLPMIIITLGTLSAFRGMTLIVSKAESVAGGDPTSSFFTVLGGSVSGYPALAIALVIVTLLLTFVFTKTRFGFAVRAVGSNPHAAYLSGYSTNKIRILVSALLGALCGFSGMLSFAFFGATDPAVGTGFELLAIASAVIGGTALSGGRGSVLGAALGALIVSAINSSLTVFGVSVNYASFVTGVVIVGAVGADALLKRRVARV
jgi:ribose transport system permease protein